jgi:hypothetical protein
MKSILELVEKICNRALSSDSILERHSVLEMLETLSHIYKCPEIDSIKENYHAFYRNRSVC